MMGMFGGFSAKKLKPQLKMAVSRFNIASNKKVAIMKQQKREIAVMLSEEHPKEEKAKIRAESLIREDNAIEAYEILQLECELLAERIKLIDTQKECPPDLLSCVATVMWAADRCDIPELELIRKQFRSKYGKQFEEKAINNVGGCLNERVVVKLSVQPPAAYLVQTYLENICEEFDVDWQPTMKVTADRMAEPMAAPVGYSVQVASGTGLMNGTETIPGQTDADDEIKYQPGDNGNTNDNGGGDFPEVFVPPPMAPSSANKGDDYKEVDIFIPAIPTAPSADTPKNDNGNENNDDPPSAPGGTSASSYADLASRFDALNR